MNFQNYTQKSMEAVQNAKNLAIQNSNQQMEQIHLLVALLQQDGGLVPQLLKKMDVTVESLEAAAKTELGKVPSVTGSREADRFYISADMDAAFTAAEAEASTMKDEFVSVEHLFLGLLETAQGGVKRIFSDYRITKEAALKALQSVRGNQRVTSDSPEGTYDALEKYGTTTAEVQMAAEALVAAGVKAVFTPTDNTVMTAELSIYETFTDAGILHFTGADSFALNGAFVGYGVDYVQLGEATADMVVELLCEGKTTADLPYQTFDNGIVTINTETAAALGMDDKTLDMIKEAFKPYCTEIVQVTTQENF